MEICLFGISTSLSPYLKHESEAYQPRRYNHSRRQTGDKRVKLCSGNRIRGYLTVIFVDVTHCYRRFVNGEERAGCIHEVQEINGRDLESREFRPDEVRSGKITE